MDTFKKSTTAWPSSFSVEILEEKDRGQEVPRKSDGRMLLEEMQRSFAHVEEGVKVKLGDDKKDYLDPPNPTFKHICPQPYPLRLRKSLTFLLRPYPCPYVPPPSAGKNATTLLHANSFPTVTAAPLRATFRTTLLDNLSSNLDIVSC